MDYTLQFRAGKQRSMRKTSLTEMDLFQLICYFQRCQRSISPIVISVIFILQQQKKVVSRTKSLIAKGQQVEPLYFKGKKPHHIS